MGRLRYGSLAETFEIGDRELAHLEIVTLAKLRRAEPFALTLDREPLGRVTLWVNPASQLAFEFDGDPGATNRAWLDRLVDLANTAGGLRLVPEPAAD